MGKGRAHAVFIRKGKRTYPVCIWTDTLLYGNGQNTRLWFPGDNRGLCLGVVIRIQWEKHSVWPVVSQGHCCYSHCDRCYYTPCVWPAPWQGDRGLPPVAVGECGLWSNAVIRQMVGTPSSCPPALYPGRAGALCIWIKRLWQIPKVPFLLLSK